MSKCFKCKNKLRQLYYNIYTKEKPFFFNHCTANTFNNYVVVILILVNYFYFYFIKKKI